MYETESDENSSDESSSEELKDIEDDELKELHRDLKELGRSAFYEQRRCKLVRDLSSTRMVEQESIRQTKLLTDLLVFQLKLVKQFKVMGVEMKDNGENDFGNKSDYSE